MTPESFIPKTAYFKDAKKIAKALPKTVWKGIKHPIYGPVMASALVLAGIKCSGVADSPAPLPPIVTPTKVANNESIFSMIDLPPYSESDDGIPYIEQEQIPPIPSNKPSPTGTPSFTSK